MEKLDTKVPLIRPALFALSTLPLILMALSLLLAPAFLSMVIDQNEFPLHMLRAIDFAQSGVNAVFSVGSIETNDHGYMLVYPPLMHMAMGMVYSVKGIQFTAALFNFLQPMMLIFGVWLLALEFYGPLAALVSSSLFLVAIPRANYFFFPTPAIFAVILALFLCHAVHKRSQLASFLLLVAGVYTHFLGLAVLIAAAAYFLKNRESEAWLQKPLVYAGAASLPLVVWQAIHANIYQEAATVIGLGWVSLISVPFLLLALAWVISVAIKRPGKEVEFMMFTAVASIIFWIALKQYDRSTLNLLALFSISLGGQLAGVENGFLSGRKVAGCILIAVVMLVLAGAGLSNPFELNNYVRIAGNYGQLDVLGFQQPLNYVSFSNAIYLPYYQLGKYTLGAQDSARVLDAFTPYGERVGVTDDDSAFAAFLAGRNSSIGDFGPWPPVSYNYSPSRVTVYADSNYQAPIGQTVIFRNSVGTIVVNGTQSPPCFADSQYCNALLTRNPALCTGLAGEQMQECILDIATTTFNVTMCNSLQGWWIPLCQFDID